MEAIQQAMQLLLPPTAHYTYNFLLYIFTRNKLFVFTVPGKVATPQFILHYLYSYYALSSIPEDLYTIGNVQFGLVALSAAMAVNYSF